jgi:hypothetical protein
VKYTQSFLEAITPTTDPFLGLFHIILCNILYLKFEVKTSDNVLKIATLQKLKSK